MARHSDDSTTITLVVPFGSNLDLIARGAIGAVNRLSDSIGGGLRAVALALSTPQDNSASVQAEVDRITAELKASSDKVDAELKHHSQ